MASYSLRPNPHVEYEVRHADADLLVVDKPAGVVTQPGLKHEHDSLLNGLFARYGNLLQNLGQDRGWGLLHRLDRPTSGLLIVALHPAAYEHLLAQFKLRQVRKLYWAVVAGTPSPAQGVIQKPLLEVAGARKKTVVSRSGKQAITAYRVLAIAGGVSLVEARPKTGRMHQIRVHLADLGHPLLGEDTYAAAVKMPPAPRLCLHAAELSFLHPSTGHRLAVHSPLPPDLARTLRRLGLPPPAAGED